MIRHMTFALTGLISVVGFAGTAKAQYPAGYSCAQMIAETEARRKIPRGLLMALAVTESAMDGQPDPHAMNIAGRTYRARDTSEMAQIIASNWKRGVTSIDVGCMQVNLKYHGAKFPSLNSLLDSATNVEYGASYLINLAIDRGSWREGVMDYHNKTNPSRRTWYGCKVWNNYLRISGSSAGYLRCGNAPGGSSVASNQRGTDTSPMVIAGYNDQRAPVTLAYNATTNVRPLVNINANAQTSGSAYGQIPMGSPLDPGQASQPSSAQPFDIEQPRQRVMGTIEIADAKDKLADVTTSSDENASAFRSIRPVDWSGRVRNQQNHDEPGATSRSYGGFARSGPAQ